MIRKSIGNGLSTARSFWGLALVLWGGNVVITVGAAWAVAWLLESAAGTSLALDILAEGYDYTVMSDLRLEGFHYGRTAIAILLIAAPCALLVQTLLTGGVLAALLAKSRVSLWHLTASCVAYAGRFLRLLLLGLGVLLVSAAVLTAVVMLGASGAANEKQLAELVGGALAVLLFVAGLVWTALDYARLWIVRDRMGSARRALWRGIRMLLRHPLATLSIQSTAAVAVVFTVMVQGLAGTPFGMESVGGIVSTVLLHQVLVLTRSYIRLTLLSAQISVTECLVPSSDREE